MTKPFPIERNAAVLGAVAGRNGDDLDGPVKLVGELRAMGLEELDEARPDGAEAGDAELEGVT
jgi:hypothetical protein